MVALTIGASWVRKPSLFERLKQGLDVLHALTILKDCLCGPGSLGMKLFCLVSGHIIQSI